MLKRIFLENFKSWRTLDIQLAPLTLLFGTNNSGKSSILQALLVLKQTLLSDDPSQALNLGGNRADFVDLGSYADLVYGHDEQRQLTLAVSFTPTSVQQPLFVGEIAEYRATWQLADEVVRHESAEPEVRLLLKDLLDRLMYMAPLRAYPRRIYQLRGTASKRVNRYGENTIDVLLAAERRSEGALSRVADALKQLGLAEQFQIRPLDTEKRFYEPRLIIEGQAVSLADVGSGVSQVLPVITLLFTAPKGAIVLLEHPELHLHPSAQAALADILLAAAEANELQLLVESHSEHLLTRLQRRIAERATAFTTPQNIRAYFCQPSPDGAQIQAVEVNAYGQILNFPPNFFGDLSGDLEAATRAGLRMRRQELEARSHDKSADS
jgi:predicted ATPase